MGGSCCMSTAASEGCVGPSAPTVSWGCPCCSHIWERGWPCSSGMALQLWDGIGKLLSPHHCRSVVPDLG